MPWKAIALGGLAAVVVLAGLVAVLPLTGNGNGPGLPLGTDPTPPAEPGDPGELPDLDDLAFDEGQPPPEARAFIDTYDVAGTVLHLAITEQRRGELAGPAGRLDVLGDVWVELDGDGSPLRFVGRYYNGDGTLVQALYQNREREVIAAIEQARVLGEDAEGCVQEGVGDPRLLASSVPFLVEPALLEADGFAASEEVPPGEAPETPVDDRVGEPERVLAMPSWSDAAIFERFDAEAMVQQFVLLDPDSGLLLGQVSLVENGDGERELAYLQGVGDIHVHAAGPGTESAFDLGDAIALCEEIEAETEAGNGD